VENGNVVSIFHIPIIYQAMAIAAIVGIIGSWLARRRFAARGPRVADADYCLRLGLPHVDPAFACAVRRGMARTVGVRPHTISPEDTLGQLGSLMADDPDLIEFEWGLQAELKAKAPPDLKQRLGRCFAEVQGLTVRELTARLAHVT
jgi:hypothetical protein